MFISWFTSKKEAYRYAQKTAKLIRIARELVFVATELNAETPLEYRNFSQSIKRFAEAFYDLVLSFRIEYKIHWKKE